MITGSYDKSQTGLFLPSAHGSNRIIFKTPGAINFTFPSWAAAAKIAIFGGGGGGGLSLVPSSPYIPAGGGAGAGFAQKFVNGVGGLTLTGTVGSPGLGGSNAAYGGSGNYVSAGQNGGTTTVSINGVTLSATGGAGAPAPNANFFAGAVGGTGSGGDINASGGAGSRIFAGSSTGLGQNGPGGGGASGSPVGTGGRGGAAYHAPSNDSGLIVCSGAGGGWGGPGADGFYIVNTTGIAFGGGSETGGQAWYGSGTESTQYLLGGRGRGPVVPVSGFTPQSATNYPMRYIPLNPPWWDLEDVGGWGGSYLGGGVGFTASGLQTQVTDAGDGGGGSGTRGQYGSAGGFGGGGAGSSFQGDPGADVYNTPAYVSPSPGGVGGGGGGYRLFTSKPPAATAIRAGDGGPGCIIVWF